MSVGPNMPISALTGTQALTRQNNGYTGDKVEVAAKEFEAVFITQMLAQMFSGIKTDGPFGGGQGEEAFRGFLLEEYAHSIEAAGGLGLAEHVKRELLSLQEIN